jgi:hypothetical protein
MIRQKGSFDIRPDRLVRAVDFFDDKEARRPTRKSFTPKRGPAKITWPLNAKKALIELTGRDSLPKALVAYEYFYNVRRARVGMRPKTSELIREEVMGADWSQKNFRFAAEEYLKYPRKGFNADAHKKRFLKVFSTLGLK